MRLCNKDASIERIQERADGTCHVIQSPIADAESRTAQLQSCTAALCPARVATAEVQQLVRASHSVMHF